MKAVFADTFYWAALTKTDDQAHALAIELSRSLAPIRLLTIDEILTEYLTFFCGAGPTIRARVADNVTRLIEKAVDVVVIPQSRKTFLAGLALYRNRLDKGYSLTDCIAMQTMRSEGITDVLTNDRHFAQEGFRTLF